MRVRGVRGAITVVADTRDLILSATKELLSAIMLANSELHIEDIASAFFTTTEDLVSVHPALAARHIGWEHVPMMCAREIPVPGNLPHCIRVLIHWNTSLEQTAIKHIYLRDAITLRPDLVASQANHG